MTNFAKRALLIVLGTLAVQACSAVGCGLGGDPIPGGYPPTDPIANAMQVRVTQPGFANLGASLCRIIGPLIVDIPIPHTQTVVTFSSIPVTIDVCQAPATCTLHVDCISGTITPSAPSDVTAVALLRGTSRNGGVRAPWPITARASGFGTQTCGVDANTAPRTLTLPFAALRNDHTFRLGYTHVVPGTLVLEDVQPSDYSITGSGILCSLADTFAGLAVTGSLDVLNDSLNRNLRAQFDAAQCQRPDPVLGCPSDTYASACTPYCHYGADPSCGCADAMTMCAGQTSECVPLLVGPERQGDLGQILAQGRARGAFGQLIAAGYGPGVVSDGGMSLYFSAGVRATDDQYLVPPSYHHACVTGRFPTSRPVIPNEVDVIGNAIPGTTLVPDVGVGISEDAYGYAMYGVYDSGTLCLDFDGTQVPQLRTGLLSVLNAQLASLIRPDTSAPLRFALRPTQVPTLRFSDDSSSPHIRAGMQDLQIDVEVFDSERYVRIFTYIADFEFPLDIEAGLSTFHFTVRPIRVSGSFIGNDEILGLTSSSGLQSAMEAAAPLVGGLISGMLPQITMPSFEDVGAIPIARVVTSNHPRPDGTASRYITLYGRIGMVTPVTSVVSPTLEAVLLDPVDPRAAQLDGFEEATTPELLVRIDAPAETGPIEVTYRIDGGGWAPWSDERERIVSSRTLLLQARHVIEARARRAGEPTSESPTSARAEVLVDLSPPSLDRTMVDGGFEVSATDLLTGDAQLRHRVVGNATWLAGPPDAVYAPGDLVEVMDEAGNVARIGAHGLDAVVRPTATGVLDAPAAAACGVDARTNSVALEWTAVALGVLIVRRRRRS